MPTPYYPAEELDEAEYAQQNTISRRQGAGNLTTAQTELLAEAEYQAAVRGLMDSEPEEIDTQEPAAEAVAVPREIPPVPTCTSKPSWTVYRKTQEIIGLKCWRKKGSQ